MMGEIRSDQKSDREGYCESSPRLSCKVSSRAQTFLWQRLRQKAFWVLLSLYNNNSSSCIWPIVQWDAIGRVSIPTPAGDEFMSTSMRIDSFHKFTSS
jgi:hypothetical protein